MWHTVIWTKSKRHREAIGLSRAPFAKFEKYEITVNAVPACLIRHIYVSGLIETRSTAKASKRPRSSKPSHEQLCTFVGKKRSYQRDWDSKQSNLRVPRYQLSRITLFGVYPRFCYRRRRRKCIFPTRLGFMLSCLSGTYRNGAHSGSLRTFVVTFLHSTEKGRERERDPRFARWILRMRNLRRPAATSRSPSLGHRRRIVASWWIISAEEM